ncbi:MAG: transposase [Minisyncoccia bacterium]
MKTWTVRPKKRGRKARRATATPVRKYLNHERVPISRECRVVTVNASRSARLRKERDAFNEKQSWHPIPDGPLILIADAIVKYRKGSWHTWFFMFLRAVDDEDAVILPPYYARGREAYAEWSNALDTIPPDALGRVKALVSDGHRGLVSYALRSNWLIQRCHIHLLMAIQARRSRWAMSRRREEGEELHTLTDCVLNDLCSKKATQALERIEEIGWLSSSKMLKKVLQGFVTSAEDYRTYINYPELNLPATSNTAESLNALVDDLSSRARGFRTIVSLNAWIIALCKERGTMKCRGKYQQN